MSSTFFSCFSPPILFCRRKVSSSFSVVARNESLCFAPRLVVLKFFFGASGLRKFPFGAPGRDGCPERDDEVAHPGRGAPPDGRLNAGRAPGVAAHAGRCPPGSAERF